MGLTYKINDYSEVVLITSFIIARLYLMTFIRNYNIWTTVLAEKKGIDYAIILNNIGYT